MMVFFGDPETKGEREDARAWRWQRCKSVWECGEGFADPFEVRMD